MIWHLCWKIFLQQSFRGSQAVYWRLWNRNDIRVSIHRLPMTSQNSLLPLLCTSAELIFAVWCTKEHCDWVFTFKPTNQMPKNVMFFFTVRILWPDLFGNRRKEIIFWKYCLITERTHILNQSFQKNNEKNNIHKIKRISIWKKLAWCFWAPIPNPAANISRVQNVKAFLHIEGFAFFAPKTISPNIFSFEHIVGDFWSRAFLWNKF